jgi:hypothetical protein
MKYQLVLQWPAVSEADFDRLISLEELIADGLGDIGIVDGHDFGSGEMNVFVHTDNPKPAFEKIKTLLSVGENMREMKAGYRNFEEDDYTAIYPEGLKQSSVI